MIITLILGYGKSLPKIKVVLINMYILLLIIKIIRSIKTSIKSIVTIFINLGKKRISSTPLVKYKEKQEQIFQAEELICPAKE